MKPLGAAKDIVNLHRPYNFNPIVLDCLQNVLFRGVGYGRPSTKHLHPLCKRAC